MADYAISNVPRRVVYAASGVGPYAFTFEILNQTDIAVYKASTLLTLTTDYTVIINANGTGSVTLVLTAGTSNITIVGAKNIQRTTDFTTGGDLFANTLNDELDNQTIFIQQVAETAERGLKAPVVDPTDINMTLPAKASRVGTVLAFNATTGNPEAGPSIGSVTTVAAQSANINTVATNIASVNTVAGNIANVNTVAGISADVTMVATFQFNVNTVADDLNEAVSEINTVAVDIANVNTVGTNIANVNTVAGISANVTTVAGISGNVTTVAGVAAGVTTVAGISSNVTTVAGISANVTTVAGISSNVTTVATNNANVTTVAGSIANVNNVGGNIANVNQVAADTVVINSASANAATATTKAAEALASANSATASAAAASAVALGSEPVRHSVRPSLLLDFANTKTLDPRITFTRASTGTFYDGKTVAKAEENLQLYSQQFDDASWTKTGSTITANSIAAPDASTTADSLLETATTAIHRVARSVTIAAGSTLTLSCFVKSNGRDIAMIQDVNVTNGFAYFNLATPAVGTIGAGATNAAITSFGSGWYRISITVTNATSSCGFTVEPRETDGGGAYLGDITKGLYLWGAQLEQRSAVTAYTPTTTAAITNYIPALQTAASGVPRFEHNPTTGESLGLEIEEQRTNLALYSEQFDNAAWTVARSTITPNTVVAPDGTLTGDKLVEDTTASNSHFVITSANITIVSSTVYTVSAFFKAAGRTRCAIQGDAGASQLGSGHTIFELTGAGTVISTSAGVSSTSITSVGNGWYRCSITATATGVTARPAFFTVLTTSVFYTGNGFDGVFVWGASLEAGAFSTSYIPTVASTVTRIADSAVMTGTNFSSWYRADEGSIYTEALTLEDNVSARTFWTISDGSAVNYILCAGGSARQLFVQVNGTNTVDLSPGFFITPKVFSANVFSKTAATYRVNDFAAVTAGSSVLTDTVSAVPVVNKFNIGSLGTNQSILCGYIKKIAYYPKRLTNAELQGVTTV